MLLKINGLLLLLIFCLYAASCANSPRSAKVGDNFAFDNKDQTFHLVRILEIDEKYLYVNLYGNVFNALPTNIKLEELFVTLPCKPSETACEGEKQIEDQLKIVRFPLNESLDENWKYVGNIPLTATEKEKFAAWKTAFRGN